MGPKIQLEKEYSPAMQEKAKLELRETPEIQAQGLKELRELLSNDKSIHYSDREDILLRYLRPTKYYAESALALMKREAAFKKKHKDALKDLTPDTMAKVMTETAPVNVIIDRDQDGRRMLVCEVGEKWKTGEVSNTQVFQIFYLIHQGALLEPDTQVNGVVVILDFKGMGLKQIASLTPNFAMLLLTFIQEVMPLRLKQVHIVNEPFMFKAVWKVFQPFIKEKLNSRLYFHGSKTQKLHQLINPDCLPKNYGGNQPEINYSLKDWFPVLKACDDVIAENNTFGMTS